MILRCYLMKKKTIISIKILNAFNSNVAIETTFNFFFFSMTIIWCETSSNHCKYEKICCCRYSIFKRNNLNVAVEAIFDEIFFQLQLFVVKFHSIVVDIKKFVVFIV